LFPGGFTRPTGDLGLQLDRRTDHVETWSPPYVCSPYCSRMLEIRPCRDEAEEELTLAIYNRIWPLDAITMVEVRAFKSQVLEYEDHIALEDGVPVGGVAVARVPSRPHVGWLGLTVPVERRGHGVGTALLAVASTWFRDRGVAEADAPVPEDDPVSISWGEKRGFREVTREGRMVLDLRTLEPPALAPPPGIEITTWDARPGVERGLYEVACEAFPDVPGDDDTVMECFEDWLAHHMTGPGDRPEGTFVALAGDEVVGYAKFSLSTAGSGTARHDMTGVRRAWRGRGVAGALKRAQIRWAMEQGYKRLMTGNEMRNEPIRRLNAQLGYEPQPGRVILRGPVSP
jgi:mycothiol synthase